MKAVGVVAFTVVCLLGALGYTASRFAANSQLTPGFFSFTASEPLEVKTLNCTDCSQTTFFSKYHASAERLDAVYDVLEEGRLTLSFGVGTVTADGKALQPGCHALTLSAGSKLIVHAQAVSFDFPAKDAACKPYKAV